MQLLPDASDELFDVGGRGPSKNVLGSTHLFEPSLVQDGDTISKPDGLEDVVGHEQDRLMKPFFEAQQFLLELVSRHGIQGSKRLVHQQVRRLGR